MSAHEWLEQAPAYALGALDEGDRASYDAHLAECEQCRNEVRAMNDVAGMIAFGVRAVEPPARLRERIVSDARRVRPLNARTGAASGGGGGQTIPFPVPQPQPASPRTATPIRPTPAPPRPSRSAPLGPLPWLAAAASIALAAWLGLQYSREHEARLLLARLQIQLEQRIAARDSVLASRDSTITALMSPDVETITLVATGRSPSGRLYLNRRAGQVTVAMFALPPAPAGRTYQFWGLRNGGAAPVSLGTFNTRGDGSGVAVLPIPPGATFAASAITEEPAGGSPQPTSSPFMVAAWKGE